MLYIQQALKTTFPCLGSGKCCAYLQAPYVGLVSRVSEKHFPVFCAAASWLHEVLQVIRGEASREAVSSAASWIGDLRQGLPPAGPDSDTDMLAHFAARGFAVNAARYLPQHSVTISIYFVKGSAWWC